jgi:hypothetical protein
MRKQPKQLDFTFVDKNWNTQPLYDLPEGFNFHCPTHGDFDLHAYFEAMEISQMIADGHMDCPECLAEIVGIGN